MSPSKTTFAAGQINTCLAPQTCKQNRTKKRPKKESTCGRQQWQPNIVREPMKNYPAETARPTSTCRPRPKLGQESTSRKDRSSIGFSPSSSRRSRASRSPHSQAPISKAVRSAGCIDCCRSFREPFATLIFGGQIRVSFPRQGQGAVFRVA